MLTVFIIILGLFILIPLVAQVTTFMALILLPSLVTAYVAIRVLKSIKYNKMKQNMDVLTLSKTLKTLSVEERKRLARIVDLYVHNHKRFKQSLKDDLLWAGIGYAAGTMGVDRAARVGIGYTVLRRYVKPSVRQAIESKEDD